MARAASARSKAVASRRLPEAAASRELIEAERLIGNGQARLASLLLRAILEESPTHAAAHRLLSIAELANGDSESATAHARTARALAPHDASMAMLLGRALKSMGDMPGAIDQYREALSLDPRLADAHVSLGIALKAVGDLPGAIASYRRALAIDSAHASAHANLGIALARVLEDRSQRTEDSSTLALQALAHAVELDGRDVAARHNLGIALWQCGRRDEAIEHMNAAMALDVSRRDSCIVLHAALVQQHYHAAARECCERWLERNAPDAEIISRLLSSLLTLNELDAADAWAHVGLSLAPDMPELRLHAANVTQQSLQVESAIEHLQHAVRMAPGYVPAWQTLLFCLSYVEEDPVRIVDAHREFGRVHGAGQALPLDVVEASNGDRRLRIGWVSGDFRRHSVSYFMEPLFERYDRDRFEWFVYDSGLQADDVTDRLRRHATQWTEVAAMSDVALASAIRADGIDVLIDLGGHTAGSRIEAFALRPAPVQMSYLGYPTTTGMPSIDYRISDTVIDPAGAEVHSVERLLRFRRSMFCYRPDAVTDVSLAPVGRYGVVTFGSFNNLAKVSARTLDLWARVLHAVPRSRLLIKARSLESARVRQRLHAELTARGIDDERVVLNPWRPDLVSHLDLYRQVDIGLDTYPFNGATTTCESLWMGVPVLSLCGPTHVSRMGASILEAAGLSDCVAHTEDDWVAKAAALASDLVTLNAMRAGLRAKMQASALMDAAGQVRELEEMLSGAWTQRVETASVS